MKTEYIRSTHRFDNEIREWIYRGEKGEDKFEEWNTREVFEKTIVRKNKPFYSFGVHSLKSHMWMGLDWIVEETIKMFKGYPHDNNTKEFLKFIKETPNHREVIENHILEDLEILISLGMVMKREK